MIHRLLPRESLSETAVDHGVIDPMEQCSGVFHGAVLWDTGCAHSDWRVTSTSLINLLAHVVTAERGGMTLRFAHGWSLRDCRERQHGWISVKSPWLAADSPGRLEANHGEFEM